MPSLARRRERRRFDFTAEGARLSEARIVEHDDEDVGRIFGQVARSLAPLVDGFLHGRPDLAAHRRIGKWEDVLGQRGHGRKQGQPGEHRGE